MRRSALEKTCGIEEDARESPAVDIIFLLSSGCSKSRADTNVLNA